MESLVLSGGPKTCKPSPLGSTPLRGLEDSSITGMTFHTGLQEDSLSLHSIRWDRKYLDLQASARPTTLLHRSLLRDLP